MDFSLTVMPRIGDYQIAKEPEDLGYDAMWFADSQMLFSDCFATMALAAKATSRIRDFRAALMLRLDSCATSDLLPAPRKERTATNTTRIPIPPSH